MMVLASSDGKVVEFPVEKWFTASERPLYIGVIAKPSPGLWEHLSRSKNVIMTDGAASRDYSIPYRIEVGENSIFFLTPKE